MLHFLHSFRITAVFLKLKAELNTQNEVSSDLTLLQEAELWENCFLIFKKNV